MKWAYTLFNSLHNAGRQRFFIFTQLYIMQWHSQSKQCLKAKYTLDLLSNFGLLITDLLSKVLRCTWHKISHFRHILPSQSIGLDDTTESTTEVERKWYLRKMFTQSAEIAKKYYAKKLTVIHQGSGLCRQIEKTKLSLRRKIIPTIHIRNLAK